MTVGGDDDLWVFINNKLIIDLGGLHTAQSKSINLDNLNLTDGYRYNFSLFFAERNENASQLGISTNIDFNSKQLVSFDGNESTSGTPMSNTITTIGGEEKLPLNTFEKTGYLFSGWATSQNGVAIYRDQEPIKNITFSAGKPLMLFAVWTDNKQIITLNPLGGTISPEKYYCISK